jgi:hypothetical protein
MNERAVWLTAKVLAVIFVATTMALRSFAFPESVMQGLRILQGFALFGVVLLTLALAARWIVGLFSHDPRRDLSDKGPE